MHSITFLTGNKKKAEEYTLGLGRTVETTYVDLEEIQSLDSKEIITKIIEEARKVLPTAGFFVEDVSLTLAHYGHTLPGPFIKWFLEKEVEKSPLLTMLAHAEDRSATGTCTIGYWDGTTLHLFSGETKGTILPLPQGDQLFGFDPLFLPEGETRTYAQMTKEEKLQSSPRGKAMRLFRAHLEREEKKEYKERQS